MEDDDSSTTTSQSNEGEENTIYDAVAGRMFHGGDLSAPRPTDEDIKSNTLEPVSADEVLARHPDAPARAEDNDIYTADRQLDQTQEQQRLPDSDLLKALHTYASDFYARATDDEGEHDFESLDETALIAMGILIEEATDKMAAQLLGEDDDQEWETDEENELDEDDQSDATESSDSEVVVKQEPDVMDETV